MRAAVVALMLAACSSPAWKPPRHAEEVVVERDLSARYEMDDTISVTALVSLDNTSAAGSVRLRHAELASALKSPHVRLARARAWFALAGLFAAAPDRAYQALEAGRDALEGYTFGDDIGHFKANLAHDGGHDADAAEHMRDALRADLRAYAQRFHADLW